MTKTLWCSAFKFSHGHIERGRESSYLDCFIRQIVKFFFSFKSGQGKWSLMVLSLELYEEKKFYMENCKGSLSNFLSWCTFKTTCPIKIRKEHDSYSFFFLPLKNYDKCAQNSFIWKSIQQTKKSQSYDFCTSYGVLDLLCHI